MRVTVLGGNGFLGLSVVEALLKHDLVPTCGRRQRSNVLALRRLKVPLVHADLDDAATLGPALAGAEVVVHCAGHYPRLSLDKAQSLALAQHQMQNLLEAAAGAGVKRLIYLSSTATVKAPPQASMRVLATERDRFDAAPGLGTYHDVKWHLENLVDHERRFETVTVCPGACLGPHDYRLGTAAFLAATARGMRPPHPDGVVNVVDVRDVGLAVARLVRLSAPPKRLLLAAEVWQLHALLCHVAPRYEVPAPEAALSAAEAIALADAEEHQAAKEKKRPALSRELVDLVVHGVPCDAHLSRELLGLQYRPLSETLDAFDAWARRIGLLPPAATVTEGAA